METGNNSISAIVGDKVELAYAPGQPKTVIIIAKDTEQGKKKAGVLDAFLLNQKFK